MPELLPARLRRARPAQVVELHSRLEALDEALSLAHGRLDEARVARARHARALAAQRLERSTGVVVAALGGGTGSGKSSLLNALVDAEVAVTGARRPTTGDTLAWVGADQASAGPLLDWLQVHNRHLPDDAGPLTGLILLDLPDHDSVVATHRLAVERFVDRVDVLVWVVDPLKYAQRALHDTFLRELASHAEVSLVVLNRIDELTVAEQREVVESLRDLLNRQGMRATLLLPVSARTGEGVAALRERLSDVAARRAAAAARLAADLRTVADDLARSCAAGGADRIALDHDTLVGALAAAAGVPRVADGAARDYRAAARRATGAWFTRWLRQLWALLAALRPGGLPALPVSQAGRRMSLPASARAAIAEAVLDAVADVRRRLPDPWPVLLHRQGAGIADDVASALSVALSRVRLAKRPAPRWWRVWHGLQSIAGVVGVVALVWLTGLAVLAWLQLPAPPTPRVGRAPWPTLLLGGSVLAGGLLALAGRRLADVGARRRATAVRRQLGQVVEEVATAQVEAPLAAERQVHDDLCAALGRVRGG